ncbi:DUF3566 domain-containing protein [Hamadaea sp. NPDC051192]|uniref:DUF3566 domain-containing protein n=1 Tax=Hamadaea sp. NPDC051192 TaxID=3154940 RepID=UPI0034343350
MTETQAMSGAAGASANPVDDGDAEANASAGRTAVGRATVPADSITPAGEETPAGSPDAAAGRSPSAEAPKPETTGSSTTSFTRPPGMTPPAERPPAGAPPRGAATVGRTPLKSVQAAGQLGAARVTEAVRAARSNVSAAASRGPRRARLAIKRIDPWSVMKFSFAVSLVLFLVVIVATSVLYLALNAMGVFDSINSSIGELASSSGGGTGAAEFKITAGGVIGTAALIGAVNVVLFTALATLGAFIYNVCSDLVGGIEVTLAERD